MLYDPKWEKTTEAKPSEPWRTLLIEAANCLQECGLAKYTRHEEQTGARCVLGAFDYVVKRRGDLRRSYNTAVAALAKTLPAEYDTTDEWNLKAYRNEWRCANWNNAEERVVTEVVSALRAAAR